MKLRLANKVIRLWEASKARRWKISTIERAVRRRGLRPPTTAERAARFKKWFDALPQEWRDVMDAP